jgi:hypothetical protein
MSAITLEEWVSRYGPLGPPAALAIALDVCVHVSRLPLSHRARVVESINVSAVVRSDGLDWSCHPVPNAADRRRVSDGEIIERAGALLLHCVTGEALADPFAHEHAFRSRLRSARPDLRRCIVDIGVTGVTARRTRGLTLTTFARELRRELGADPRSESRAGARVVAGIAAGLMGLTAAGLWLAAPRPEPRGAHGLTAAETAVLDMYAEAAQSFAIADEHTAAYTMYTEIARLWRGRVPADDPRIIWNDVQTAWVRSLAGDRLTAEQLLEVAPLWLASQVGDDHPYTRAARLALADNVEARGAADQASALRAEAARNAAALFGHDLQRDALAPGVSGAPGVLAHAAPNTPEREGFRLDGEGRSFAPLTSAERLMAERNGWRLHIVAAGRCRTSLTIGDPPHTVVVTLDRGAAGRWEISIDGLAPVTTVRARAGERVGVSLTAGSTGAVQMFVSNSARQSFVIDRPALAPVPPYSLSFTDASSCALVWLEIPFPGQPGS